MFNSTSGGRNALRGAVAVIALALMTACAPIYSNHGYAPTDSELAEVIVGVDSRATVAELIGPPTAGGVMGDGNFYYVQSRFRTLGAFAPEEIEREVVAVSFDAEGIVRNIERFGLERGQIVRLSRRVTDDGIQDTTFLGQLFGALGNFDAGQIIDAPG